MDYKNPIYTRTWFDLQYVWGFLLGGLSDCEELVGVTHSVLLQMELEKSIA